jgi:hypothetical protein
MSASRIPNFFIVGAPKCGTTAMSEYLRTHPDICFSEPKEPSFFNTDFSSKFRTVKTQEEYLSYFQCKNKEKVVGEGSTWYLYSKEAVPNILKFNPNSKFVVMVRNPVDMAYSLHAQLLYSLDEDVSDFKIAWNLQDKRAKGRRVPSYCDDKQILQYGDICKIGEQLERRYGQVDRDRVHVIIFDDFVKDTRGEYLKLLDFLGLEDDGRKEFSRINSNHEANRTWKLVLWKVGNLVTGPVEEVSDKVKDFLGIEDWGILNSLHSLGDKKVERKPLDPEFREELKDYFRADVELLSELLDRDLTYWVEPKSVNDSDAE